MTTNPFPSTTARALAAQLYASDPRLFDAMCAAGVYDGAQAKAAKAPYVVMGVKRNSTRLAGHVLTHAVSERELDRKYDQLTVVFGGDEVWLDATDRYVAGQDDPIRGELVRPNGRRPWALTFAPSFYPDALLPSVTPYVASLLLSHMPKPCASMVAVDVERTLRVRERLHVRWPDGAGSVGDVVKAVESGKALVRSREVVSVKDLGVVEGSATYEVLDTP